MAQALPARGSLLGEVWKQFFGSDLETGYTFIYTWLANQFGHFMIGFAGTFLFLWLLSLFLWLLSYPLAIVGQFDVLRPKTSGDVIAVLTIAFVWFLLWIFKEFRRDVAGALCDLHDAGQQRKVLQGQATGPNPNGWLLGAWTALRDFRTRSAKTAEKRFKDDMVHDSLIDIWFYFSGVTTSLMMLFGPALATKSGLPWLAGGLPLVTFIILLSVSKPISEEWLWRNIAFDKAQLPFVGRFALTSRPFKEQPREVAINFALKSDKPGHLVIIGPPKSGRTTIAVALGVEALLDSSPPGNIVVYTTLCKLLDHIAEVQTEPPRPVWPPEEAGLLIVDDVGAQTGSPTPLLTAERFKTLLEGVLTRNPYLQAVAQQKRVIWVVGDDPKLSNDWMSALTEALAGCRVVDVVLPDPIPPEARRRQMQHSKGATRGRAFSRTVHGKREGSI